MRQRLAVALSGGVDSAVAAAILREQGHDLLGVTQINLPDSRCSSPEAVQDARRVADCLGIPHRVYDFSRAFTQEVVTPFCDSYASGRTPLPCALCNAGFKFGRLLERAWEEFGAEGIATGHYARSERDAPNGRHRLLRGIDPAKDQSYMLHRLTQAQLSVSVFPLGTYRKVEIRRMARELGLAMVAEKADSQDLCFYEGDPHQFLDRELGDRVQPGVIVDQQGHVLGRHRGIAHYTIGQRRGLGVSSPVPLYVLKLEDATNRVVVGPRSSLLATGLVAFDFNWLSIPQPVAPIPVQVKIRYNAPAVPATALVTGNRHVTLFFAEPQTAVTPGQAAVLYQGDVLLGGGWIERALTEPDPNSG